MKKKIVFLLFSTFILIHFGSCGKKKANIDDPYSVERLTESIKKLNKDVEALVEDIKRVNDIQTSTLKSLETIKDPEVVKGFRANLDKTMKEKAVLYGRKKSIDDNINLYFEYMEESLHTPLDEIYAISIQNDDRVRAYHGITADSLSTHISETLDDETIVYSEKSIVQEDVTPKQVTATKAPLKTGTSGKPKMGIIVDDVYSYASISLIKGYPVTPSFFPYMEDKESKDLMKKHIDEALAAGFSSIMGHLPMEADNYTNKGLAGNFELRTDMSDEELMAKINEVLDRYPSSVKMVNNHTGSAFTKDSRCMRMFLEELRKREMSFFNSQTMAKDTPKELKAIPFNTSREVGVKYASNFQFLDNIKDIEKITIELNNFGALAEKRFEKGYKTPTFGIIHANTHSMRALRGWMDANLENYEFVLMSEYYSDMPKPSPRVSSSTVDTKKEPQDEKKVVFKAPKID